MTLGASNVVAVTVTYGKRGRYLKKVVKAALRCGVAKVIVVTNGNDAEAVNPDDFNAAGGVPEDKRVILARVPKNRGSAGGFSEGIKQALKLPDCEYLWLLDDDNEPEPASLDILLQMYQLMGGAVIETRLALVSFRPARERQHKILSGAPREWCYAPANSCSGFHIREFWELLSGARRKRKHILPSGELRSYSELEFAPYGGLFLHKRLLIEIGLPDERFFLYHDDTEFTYRITRMGGKILLVRDSKVNDLEESWLIQQPRRRTIFARLLTEESDVRAFYAVRNSIFIGRRWRNTSDFVFLVNAGLFALLLLCFAAILWRPRRARLVLKAVVAGITDDFNPMPTI